MKELKIIFLGIILPLVLASLNGKYSSSLFFSWGHDHLRLVNGAMFFISILACVLLFVKSKHLAWKVFAASLGVLLAYIGTFVISFRLPF